MRGLRGIDGAGKVNLGEYGVAYLLDILGELCNCIIGDRANRMYRKMDNL
jgi:hypothetical protein